MRTRLRSKFSLLFVVFALMLALPAVALADNINDDIADNVGAALQLTAGDASSKATAEVKIVSVGGTDRADGNTQCNIDAASESVTLTFVTPSGVTATALDGATANPGEMKFTACDVFQTVEFSAGADAVAGNYTVTATYVENTTGDYNNNVNIPIKVNAATGGGGDTDPPANVPPTADAGGPYEVDEGSSVNLDASSSSDSDGTIDSYAWDFDSDGDYDDATGVSPSFSAANLDGPSSHTVGLQVTDDDSATGTDTATIDVINVRPTITDLTASSQGAVTGKQVTFTGTVSDPAPADTHTWEWSVNGGQSYSSGSNPFTYTFPSCGTFNISAIATDDDGGISQPRALANPVSVYNASFSPPVDTAPYVNTVQKGRVIPVKISVSCNGNIANLSPSIQLLSGDKSTGNETTADEIETLSVSAADTTGIMRAVDGGYIYNLQVPSNATANQLFTIRVNPFGGSNASSNMYAVLKIRK